MFPIFNINKQIKSSTQKHNLNETAVTHSDEPKSKKICNHEQHDEHNDNDENIENIQLKNHDLNLNMQSVVDLGDINSGPKQPKLQTFPLTKFGTQNRSFNAKYYSEYEWLEYNVSSNAIFCFNCVHFVKNLKTENLITTGFNNWRKIYILKYFPSCTIFSKRKHLTLMKYKESKFTHKS